MENNLNYSESSKESSSSSPENSNDALVSSGVNSNEPLALPSVSRESTNSTNNINDLPATMSKTLSCDTDSCRPDSNSPYSSVTSLMSHTSDASAETDDERSSGPLDDANKPISSRSSATTEEMICNGHAEEDNTTFIRSKSSTVEIPPETREMQNYDPMDDNATLPSSVTSSSEFSDETQQMMKKIMEDIQTPRCSKSSASDFSDETQETKKCDPMEDIGAPSYSKWTVSDFSDEFQDVKKDNGIEDNAIAFEPLPDTPLLDERICELCLIAPRNAIIVHRTSACIVYCLQCANDMLINKKPCPLCGFEVIGVMRARFS